MNPYTNRSDVSIKSIKRSTRALMGCLGLISFFAFACSTVAQCVDARGIPVTLVRNDRLNDVAMASLGPRGEPIVQYNPRVLSMMALQTQRFFYMHECGHHALGHVLRRIPMGIEQEADCFGIVTLVRNGEFSDSDIQIVQGDLARAGRGDWTHLPGPQRAINLRACLAAAGTTTSSGPTLERDNDSDEMKSCLADMPDKCLSTCMTAFGLSNSVCSNQMCATTPTNVRSWRRKCEREVRNTAESDRANDASARLGFAGVVDKLLESSKNSFMSVRGSLDRTLDRDRIYNTQIILPGAEKCSIWIDDSGLSRPHYTCEIKASNDRNEIENQYLDMLRSIRSALPSASWTSSERIGTSGSIQKSTRFSETASNGRTVSIDISKRTGTLARTTGTYYLAVTFRSPESH